MEILEMKETLNQIKSSMEYITKRLDHLEDRTSDNEDKIFNFENKVTPTENMVRNHELNLQELWDIMKRTNLRIIRIEEGTELQTKGMNNLFNKIISENFSSLKNEMENQLQEAYRTQNAQNQNSSIPKHIIMKMPSIQNKDRILKPAREKHQITYRGKPIPILADFSAHILKATRARNNIF